MSTKERAKLLHRELMYDGVRADHISAEQSQAARGAAVDNFRAGRTWVLIATDLIGRGMDFVGVNTVRANCDVFSLPYVHLAAVCGRVLVMPHLTWFLPNATPTMRTPQVINYDFPKTTADYIHRVGRTGRAGRPGECTLASSSSHSSSARCFDRTLVPVVYKLLAACSHLQPQLLLVRSQLQAVTGALKHASSYRR